MSFFLDIGTILVSFPVQACIAVVFLFVVYCIYSSIFRAIVRRRSK